jgi:hypothetical protein
MLQSRYKPQRCDSGKVTVIELLWLILWIGGATAGCRVGYTYFSIAGAVLGVVLGFGAGFLVSCGIAYLLNASNR